jgi:hypothetical protein
MRWLVPLALVSLALPLARAEKLTDAQKFDIIRGMTAEYATAKVALAHSKKALEFSSHGDFDKPAWQAAAEKFGPAARVGDLVQVTKVDIQDDKIVLDINGGYKSGKPSWKQRIQIGIGTRTVPLSQSDTNAPGGTSIALLFHSPVPPLRADQIKKMLAPILDFEKHSAAETYMESLPPEIQTAVKQKRAIPGMDRDQVIFALGRPVRKVRETVDGIETEDWIYGTPPGRIVFVTFNGNKVIKVKEDYAGLGTEAPPLTPPR